MKDYKWEAYRPVKKWLSQRCIGYQMYNQQITCSIFEGQVELTDGEITTAWLTQEYTGYKEHFGQESPILAVIRFEQPRIDLEAHS